MRKKRRITRPRRRGSVLTMVLRASAWVLLICCFYCKMIDLDCALYQPMHCQSVLEGGDNTFGHAPEPLPALELAVVILEPVPIPAPLSLPAPPLAEHQACWPVRPAWSPPQSSKRPPPFSLA